MSAITKERIELFIKNPIDNGLTRGEQMELARIALASFESEAVATFYKSECGNVFNTLDSWLPVEGVNKLYAAPQLPQQAVPDEMTPKQASRSYCGEVRGYRDGWNDCRAAMLQGAEPSTDNTNQQFESLSRGAK